ncbi:RNA recognition motif (RRM) superfamily protein [Metarhizium robertsii]|uniref:RNA recognition domain-containing protein n=2 Tax=Metarhizium robertsii TaxID=568076 RepID=E9FDF8_METRA|nr:RNA recognition domain-containing protein [Metarhizium robertsii ARSEF 23]EFY94239.2 RNA recognition domain-containing protein [Metarhizium robertsii ARSEF 23]EXU97177.1 RNA recognition motif (RRM) superfamily protein [Metarhizium robertsii]
MNKIRAIQELNRREIENGITPEGSWHVDYRDTAFIYFGGLPYDLTEGDIITIFSQFGEPVFLKLARDKETGKSKGFGWLKYEDQRSTDLAVDNLGGADISGRMISVDHARYKPRDDEDPEEFNVSWEAMMRREGKLKDEDEESEEEEVARPMLPEERELAILMRDHDDDDPMKGFLVEEKKREVEEARSKADRKERHGDKHRRRHRRRDKSPEGGDRRHRERSRERESKRQRDDSRDRERRRRRDHDEDRDKRRSRRDRDDDDEREWRRDRERDRPKHDRNRSQERTERHRDDEKRRRRSRSRSPRRHED